MKGGHERKRAGLLLGDQEAENAERCINATMGAQQCVPGGTLPWIGSWEMIIKEPGEP